MGPWKASEPCQRTFQAMLPLKSICKNPGCSISIAKDEKIEFPFPRGSNHFMKISIGARDNLKWSNNRSHRHTLNYSYTGKYLPHARNREFRDSFLF